MKFYFPIPNKGEQDMVEKIAISKDEILPYPSGEIREIRLPYGIDYMIEHFAKEQGRSFLGMMLYMLALGIHNMKFDPRDYLCTEGTQDSKIKTYTPREGITLSKRYEVLLRDNFICVYCGKRPPEVKLEVDHKIPKCKGGVDEIENLVTSCFECNRGKSDK